MYAEGQALHDAIWTSAGRGQSADGAASPRSSGIDLRADNLTQDLYTLRESAPDEVQRARIVDVLVALQSVRSAMEVSADLEGRLAVFQSALRGCALRRIQFQLPGIGRVAVAGVGQAAAACAHGTAPGR